MTTQHVLHKADSRGHANHGWLDSFHTFSFANYHNPERIHFGALRVLNDDTVAPGMGFGKHPHDNMEIISIPLEGELEHRDSMDNIAVIREGDIQVMSAGTGVYHSEFNRSKSHQTRFLQIWVFPNKRDVTPRYGQVTLNPQELQNRLALVLSPDSQASEGVWIHQDAWFHLGKFDPGSEETYSLKKEGNGIYFFVIDGDWVVDGQNLFARDGLGIVNASEVNIKSISKGTILVMEVPMYA